MKDLCLTQYTEKIAPMVFRENHRQLVKWGVQDHEPSEWLMFTTEELGELAEAIGEFQFRWKAGSCENVIKEAIQTATLCLKIAEMFNDLLPTELQVVDSK
jgi:NTP pyrophosphatase (non-canonical NTP hydrolase)